MYCTLAVTTMPNKSTVRKMLTQLLGKVFGLYIEVCPSDSITKFVCAPWDGSRRVGFGGGTWQATVYRSKFAD